MASYTKISLHNKNIFYYCEFVSILLLIESIIKYNSLIYIYL